MEQEKIRKLREIIRKFEREMFFQNNLSCCSGVTLAQCHTLLEIENKGVISVTELANCMSLDKSTVSRTIDSLVNKGLINREIPSDNRRMAQISLTEEGQQTCDDINSRNDQYIHDNLSDFTGMEQKELLKLFEKITNNMIQQRKTNQD